MLPRRRSRDGHARQDGASRSKFQGRLKHALKGQIKGRGVQRVFTPATHSRTKVEQTLRGRVCRPPFSLFQQRVVDRTSEQPQQQRLVFLGNARIREVASLHARERRLSVVVRLVREVARVPISHDESHGVALVSGHRDRERVLAIVLSAEALRGYIEQRLEPLHVARLRQPEHQVENIVRVETNQGSPEPIDALSLLVADAPELPQHRLSLGVVARLEHLEVSTLEQLHLAARKDPQPHAL
eukprot:scaffold3709_cov68-Phaeocystis_antarctica.AAC.9